ncbi:hypothetical protein F5Y16DRAFT_417201 [Xylariaceae sp. FL0255]|nr:hypothetical protein F5Y16DRAFT_417201 [Xylariaceae sp. FL0255]
MGYPQAILTHNVHQIPTTIKDTTSAPSLSPKKTTDFPNEILHHIFSYIHTPTTLTGPHSYDPKSPHIETIKNARLTCRRISQVASHYLLDHVSIEPTWKSLRRLACISKHPIIREEIRVVYISFAQYNSQMTRYWNFTKALVEQLHTERLEKKCLPFDFRDEAAQEMMTLTRTSAFIEDIWKANWCYVYSSIWDGSQTRFLLEAVKRRTFVAFEEYRRLFQEQNQALNDPSYKIRILEALARMPQIKTVMFNDESTPRHTYTYGRDVWEILRADPSGVARRYLKPLSIYQTQQCKMDIAGFPTELALELLAALSAIKFQDLRLVLPFGDHEPVPIHNSNIFTDLNKMGKQLSGMDVAFPASWSTAPREFVQRNYAIIMALLGATQVTALHLNSWKPIMCWHIYSPYVPAVLSPILARQQRGKLRSLVMNHVEIDRDVLNNIMLIAVKASQCGSGKPKLHLELIAIKLDENIPWLEVLDLLRGKVDDTSILRYPNGNMSGLEYNEMVSIFDNHNDQAILAELYIRGHPVPNPITSRLLTLE